MSLRLHGFEAKGFRSLRSISYPASDLDVFVGANGVGKTNLYRSLELLHAAAGNTLARDLARDGGLKSTLWAGPHGRSDPVRVRLAVDLADRARGSAGRYRYEIEIGYPPPVSAAFEDEAQIKMEAISAIGETRSVRLIERVGPSVMARGEDGRPGQIDLDLLASETVLGRLEDPSRYPELEDLRRTLLQWRFYHGLRTDAGSPLRQPCAALATPTLASDGADLAAVFATLVHIRQDAVDLFEVVDQAFPGAQLIVPTPERTASFGVIFPEFPRRVFQAHELSDGTLRFLALAGALLAYRAPPFIALNEPEASLHPDLLKPLAGLIVRAARRSQVWLVTHAQPLADAIVAAGAGQVRVVTKQKGATQIEGLRAWGSFGDDEDE